MDKGAANDFTSGSIPSHLIRFSGPFLLANLLQACYSAADVIVVGHALGSVGTSAIGIGAQVMVILTAACSGLCTGGTIALSQHKGARDLNGQQKSVQTFLILLFLSACGITLLGAATSDLIVRWMHAPAEAAAPAASYLRICCGGIVFIFGYNAICAIFRGLGDSVHPLYFIAAATVLNVILDVLFVFGLSLGVQGAALATVIAQGVSFLCSAIFMMRTQKRLLPRPGSRIGIDRSELLVILKVGMPSMFQTVLVHFSFLVVGAMMNQLGVIASAVNTIGTRISNFFLLPRQAIAFAAGNIVGQNMGARKPERAEQAIKIGVKLSTAIALLLVLLINLFPGLVIAIFDDTPGVVAEGTRYIHIVSIGFLLMAPMTVYNNLAIGVGRSTRAMVNSLTDSVFVRLPLCVILNYAAGLSLTGIYIGMAVSPLAAVLMGWWYFHRGNWRNEQLLKKS